MFKNLIGSKVNDIKCVVSNKTFIDNKFINAKIPNAEIRQTTFSQN